jgi:putative DNA primase/helicase
MNNAELIQSGLAVVPLPYGQKGPTAAGWNLRSNCITTPSQADQLLGKNVGLAHAYCTPTPTCAIDIDNFKQAKAWLATHSVDLKLLLLTPGAVVIWSGKEFSLKLLYRLPPGVPALESKKINGNDGKSTLEFRCATKEGKTVQDVLPPSIHPDGHQYQWLGQGDPLNLPEIPSVLLELWLVLIRNEARVAHRRFTLIPLKSLSPESPRRVATISAALNHINADCSYESWRNVVWAVLSTRWTCAEDLAQAWSMTAPDRYREDTFWRLVNSYMPDHSAGISVGTIYYHARKGGWNG